MGFDQIALLILVPNMFCLKYSRDRVFWSLDCFVFFLAGGGGGELGHTVF